MTKLTIKVQIIRDWWLVDRATNIVHFGSNDISDSDDYAKSHNYEDPHIYHESYLSKEHIAQIINSPDFAGMYNIELIK